MVGSMEWWGGAGGGARRAARRRLDRAVQAHQAEPCLDGRVDVMVGVAEGLVPEGPLYQARYVVGGHVSDHRLVEELLGRLVVARLWSGEPARPARPAHLAQQ